MSDFINILCCLFSLSIAVCVCVCLYVCACVCRENIYKNSIFCLSKLIKSNEWDFVSFHRNDEESERRAQGHEEGEREFLLCFVIYNQFLHSLGLNHV